VIILKIVFLFLCHNLTQSLLMCIYKSYKVKLHSPADLCCAVITDMSCVQPLWLGSPKCWAGPIAWTASTGAVAFMDYKSHSVIHYMNCPLESEQRVNCYCILGVHHLAHSVACNFQSVYIRKIININKLILCKY
jgi:hypothetical protein